MLVATRCDRGRKRVAGDLQSSMRSINAAQEYMMRQRMDWRYSRPGGAKMCAGDSLREEKKKRVQASITVEARAAPNVPRTLGFLVLPRQALAGLPLGDEPYRRGSAVHRRYKLRSGRRAA